MHSRGRAVHRELIAKLGLKAINEHGPARTIDLPHLADVPSEMTERHEIGEHLLKEIGRKDVHRKAHGYKVVHEITRYDDVADAQRWKENLAEGADVDHARVDIEALEGRDRLGIESIFAVVIILDDPGPGTLGPIEEKKPARCAHGRTERVLVRRR